MAAIKQYYHDLDLVKVGQLLNTRIHNVTTVERSALAATLGVANVGLQVYDTDLKTPYYWDGTTFTGVAATVEGDVIFKGIITDLSDPVGVEPVSGYQYIIDANGTLTITGVTITPNNVVEQGDTLLFTSPTTAYVFQRNDAQATETVLGNVTLATQAEVNAGTNATDAVTPVTLHTKLVGQSYARQFFGSFTLVANTPLTITHNLNLTDRDAFTINAMLNNSQVSLDVDSVSANSLTVTSLVALSNVKITIVGASAA